MYKSVLENPLCLEGFELQHILEYPENFSNSTGNNSVVTRMKQGLELYNDKFLSDLRFVIPEDGKFTITADVRAAMKKRVKYQPVSEVQTDYKVLQAQCTCAVGVVPAYCKHVFTLLHAISDYSKQKLYAAPTAKLQTWHQPKAVKTVPLPCQEVFGKPSTYEGPSNTNFNWGALKDFSLPIFDACMESVEAKYKLTIPLPAVACSNIGINEFPDDLTLRKMLFINMHYSKDLSELHEIEKKTVEQKSLEWQNGRKIHLTGSNIKDIATRVKDFENLAASIRRKKDMDISFIPAVAYGIQNEEYVRQWYIARNPQCVVRKTGLVIHPVYQYIAASPDGLIKSGDDYMLLEIK
ncbi:hypothetical protein AVEN_215834-1 [Araneus ventricosus]|uniref:SWIM-type domain-containing protein n=1 Tax=Araneus ventricosus TaxID=182803 RepID=A0A4Y2QI42_ARAVE|nr:hypothetical protein AVEN_215834-1 [Araneus ventricosus]